MKMMMIRIRKRSFKSLKVSYVNIKDLYYASKVNILWRHKSYWYKFELSVGLPKKNQNPALYIFSIFMYKTIDFESPFRAKFCGTFVLVNFQKEMGVVSEFYCVEGGKGGILKVSWNPLEIGYVTDMTSYSNEFWFFMALDVFKSSVHSETCQKIKTRYSNVFTLCRWK